ncbi:MAG: B12-binding domain-containing radical SAM protein [Candidatus Helarchaeota archaeon]
MKILLVNPTGPKIGMDHFLSAPPLGLMSIAATVPDHKVEILDLRNYQYPPGFIERKIQQFDVVGVSASTSMIKGALDIFRIAKQYDVKTILGGYHGSLVPETALYPDIDLVVRGEGEKTFPEVVEAWQKGGNLKEIKGINFKFNNQLYQTENRPPLDLNKAPFPRRDLVKKYHYHYFWATIDALESARGCPHHCHFCCISSHWGRGWRAKTPERVIEEFHHMDRKKQWFIFNDSESTLNMRRIEKICHLTKEYGYHRKWKSCQGRVDDVVRHPKIIGKMASAGWKMMFLGIESVHQKTLDTIGKKTSIAQIRQAVKILHDYGITIFGSIIIGNLGESKEDVKATIKFAEDLDIDIMQFTPLTPYPATQLFEQATQEGWIVDYDFTHWNLVQPIMRTPDLSVQEIYELVQKAYEEFYFKLTIKLWQFFFLRALLRFIHNPRFWWFFKMARKFVINGLKTAAVWKDQFKMDYNETLIKGSEQDRIELQESELKEFNGVIPLPGKLQKSIKKQIEST